MIVSLFILCASLVGRVISEYQLFQSTVGSYIQFMPRSSLVICMFKQRQSENNIDKMLNLVM